MKRLTQCEFSNAKDCVLSFTAKSKIIAGQTENSSNNAWNYNGNNGNLNNNNKNNSNGARSVTELHRKQRYGQTRGDF